MVSLQVLSYLLYASKHFLVGSGSIIELLAFIDKKSFVKQIIVLIFILLIIMNWRFIECARFIELCFGIVCNKLGKISETGKKTD